MSSLRKYAFLVPIFTCFIAIATIATTFALTSIDESVNHGDFPLFYISDSGDRPPQQYVFTLGMAVSGGLLVVTSVLNVMSFLERDTWQASARRLVKASLVPGVLSGLTLVALAILDTRSWTDLHLYAAIAFFFFDAIFITLNTIAYELFRREEATDRGARRSAYAKIAIAALFWLAVIVYMPVGLSVAGSDCWVEDERTKEFDYSTCPAIHTMRIISQYLSVIFSLLFYGSFSLDLWRKSELVSMI